MYVVLLTTILHTGIYPNAFKIAKVIPIFKKGDPGLLTNYRPISLLPTLSKIFERAIFTQLYSFFITNNILCEQQYELTKLIDHTYEQMDQISNLILITRTVKNNMLLPT